MSKFRVSFVCISCFLTGSFISLNSLAAETEAAKVARPAVVNAENETNASIQPLISIWSSEAELGFIQTTGNTETESLNFRFGLNNKRKDWEHTLKVESTNSSDSTGATAERYFLSFKSQYSLSELDYLFGRIKYEDNRFSGYNYQASEVLGYGRRLVNSGKLKINTEVGAGVRQNSFDNGSSNAESIFVIGGDVNWKISKTASLTEEITIEIGEDRTISKSVSGLETKINHSLSSKITYTVKNSSDVPVGTRKTDTELAVTLVYAFK